MAATMTRLLTKAENYVFISEADALLSRIGTFPQEARVDEHVEHIQQQMISPGRAGDISSPLSGRESGDSAAAAEGGGGGGGGGGGESDRGGKSESTTTPQRKNTGVTPRSLLSTVSSAFIAPRGSGSSTPHTTEDASGSSSLASSGFKDSDTAPTSRPSSPSPRRDTCIVYMSNDQKVKVNEQALVFMADSIDLPSPSTPTNSGGPARTTRSQPFIRSPAASPRSATISAGSSMTHLHGVGQRGPSSSTELLSSPPPGLAQDLSGSSLEVSPKASNGDVSLGNRRLEGSAGECDGEDFTDINVKGSGATASTNSNVNSIGAQGGGDGKLSARGKERFALSSTTREAPSSRSFAALAQKGYLRRSGTNEVGSRIPRATVELSRASIESALAEASLESSAGPSISPSPSATPFSIAHKTQTRSSGTASPPSASETDSPQASISPSSSSNALEKSIKNSLVGVEESRAVLIPQSRQRRRDTEGEIEDLDATRSPRTDLKYDVGGVRPVMRRVVSMQLNPTIVHSPQAYPRPPSSRVGVAEKGQIVSSCRTPEEFESAKKQGHPSAAGVVVAGPHDVSSISSPPQQSRSPIDFGHNHPNAPKRVVDMPPGPIPGTHTTSSVSKKPRRSLSQKKKGDQSAQGDEKEAGNNTSSPAEMSSSTTTSSSTSASTPSSGSSTASSSSGSTLLKSARRLSRNFSSSSQPQGASRDTKSTLLYQQSHSPIRKKRTRSSSTGENLCSLPPNAESALSPSVSDPDFLPSNSSTSLSSPSKKKATSPPPRFKNTRQRRHSSTVIPDHVMNKIEDGNVVNENKDTSRNVTSSGATVPTLSSSAPRHSPMSHSSRKIEKEGGGGGGSAAGGRYTARREKTAENNSQAHGSGVDTVQQQPHNKSGSKVTPRLLKGGKEAPSLSQSHRYIYIKEGEKEIRILSRENMNTHGESADGPHNFLNLYWINLNF